MDSDATSRGTSSDPASRDTDTPANPVPPQRSLEPEVAASGGGKSPADAAPPTAGDTRPVIHLEAPGTGVRDTWKAMGPGIAAAMTGIGSSHIIHAPVAGATYEYAFLWIIPFAYLLKYLNFEFAHRYTMVRGESIMDAYERIGRGRGNWPLWYFGFQTLANTFGIAGRALGAGALLFAAFPGFLFGVEEWTVAILLSCLLLLWLGKYQGLELAVKLAIIVFCAATLLAFVLQFPSPAEYAANLLPWVPPVGSLLLFGAMWGYFPTTVEVGPMQSNWAVDKKSGMVRVRELERQGYRVTMDKKYLRNHYKLFKRDMNISYVVSMLTGMAFLIVGAVVLFPRGEVPEGAETGTTLASIYTDIFGQWVFPVIIAGGVAALWSTVLTYFDGQARIFMECAVRLRKAWNTPMLRIWIYRGFQLLWVAAGTAIVYGMPRPVFVVQIASVLALFFSPVIFWLAITAIKQNFKSDLEKEFMPPKWMFAWGWVGIVCLAGVSVYVLWFHEDYGSPLAGGILAIGFIAAFVAVRLFGAQSAKHNPRERVE